MGLARPRTGDRWVHALSLRSTWVTCRHPHAGSPRVVPGRSPHGPFYGSSLARTGSAPETDSLDSSCRPCQSRHSTVASSLQRVPGGRRGRGRPGRGPPRAGAGAGCPRSPGEVDAGGVALEHPVRHAARPGRRAPGRAGCCGRCCRRTCPRGRSTRRSSGSSSASAGEVRRDVPGVDQLHRPGAQVDAADQPGDEVLEAAAAACSTSAWFVAVDLLEQRRAPACARSAGRPRTRWPSARPPTPCPIASVRDRCRTSRARLKSNVSPPMLAAGSSQPASVNAAGLARLRARGAVAAGSPPTGSTAGLRCPHS